MATTKVTSNLLAPSAAQTNINSGASLTLSVPTQVNNTLTTNNKVVIDSANAIANPKMLIMATTASGAADNAPLVIKGSGVNMLASVNLRTTGGSGESYDAWVTGKVGGGIQVNNSFSVSGGNSGPVTGSTIFIVQSTGGVGIGVASPNTKAALDITSTTKGFLPPRMTTTERNTIATPPAGLVIYNTTTNNLNSYSGSAWVELVDSADLGTNVANFLEFPTSDNLASALTDENGTGGGFVRAEGATLTTPTFTGSAARANGQNAVPATDDEIIVRQRSAKESFYSIGTVRNIVYPPSFGTSGTGSATAITDAGNRLFSLNSGTANSGWARATLARGVSTAPNVTGTGINYSKKLGISIAFTTGKSNFTNTGNVTRIVFGTNQTATADGVDPLSALGFGIEFRANGTSHDIRVFGHNGTSMTYSSWVNSGCPSSVASAVHTLGVESDGAGNLFGFFAVNSSRTLVTVTGTGGPTGTGTSASSYVDVQSCNSASSTTSQIVVGFDAKIFVE